MMPDWVKFEVSDDGNNFTIIDTIKNDIPVYNQESVIKEFTTQFTSRKTRYIRVTAKVLDALPKGHPGEGQPAWLFADEIVVN